MAMPEFTSIIGSLDLSSGPARHRYADSLLERDVILRSSSSGFGRHSTVLVSLGRGAAVPIGGKKVSLLSNGRHYQCQSFRRAWHQLETGQMPCLPNDEINEMASSQPQMERSQAIRTKGQKRDVDTLWQELFLDPAQWLDHRLGKENPKYPDFRHRKTNEGLWLDNESNPSWVAGRLAALAPGTVEPSTFAFNKTLVRYVKAGHYEETLKLFERSQREGVKADSLTFIPVLRACARLKSLEMGRRVHAQIVESGFDSDVCVGSTLVDMYLKLGRIDDAWRVFNELPNRNMVVWSTMIWGFVRAGQAQRALELSHWMRREGVQPSPVGFVGLLNACASENALEEGRLLHKQIIQRRCESNTFVGNSLIDMYAKCGSIEDALRVFNQMPKHDVVSWNAMILGLVKCKRGQEALELSKQMLLKGVSPSTITFVGMLNACASLMALEEGRRIHEEIIQRGCVSNVFVGTSLVDMYIKCGSLDKARAVFDKMPTRNVVSWNAMILGHVKYEQAKEALELYQDMQREGMKPSPATVVAAVKACTCAEVLEDGRNIHKQIIEWGFESDIFVSSSLVDMYAKCGSIEDAWTVFNKMRTRDVVAWSTIILGYVKCGQGLKALELSKQMRQEGVEPNFITHMAMINACASVQALDEGRDFHDQLIRSGSESDVFVSNSLIDMYAKCASIEDAQRVFDKMESPDVISWNTMILGYVRCGQGQKALELSWQMQREGLKPVAVTFKGMLSACASIGALDEGKVVHEQIIESGLESDMFVACSLIDMYSKCWSIEDATRIFDNIPKPDAAVWNAMILGLVKCGQGWNALELFQQMEQGEVEPDSVTFVGVLNACASVVAIGQGRRFHGQVIQRGFESDVFVCSSLIDMYAKCGSIDDAWKVFNKMLTSDVVVWNAMLRGFVIHGHTNEAFEHFHRMQEKGVKANQATFSSLLSACSNSDLVDEGLLYLESMNSVYNVQPTVGHYAFMVDLLGRLGRLQEAEDLVKRMPPEPGVSLWMSLLNSCRTHGNVEMAERIANRVLLLDAGNAVGELT